MLFIFNGTYRYRPFSGKDGVSTGPLVGCQQWGPEHLRKSWMTRGLDGLL